MEKKNKWIWGIRIVLFAIVLILGTYFAFSKEYYDTSYNKVKSFSGIDAVEVQNGDVLKQTMSFSMDKIHSLGICAVNRSNDCRGIIKVSILDEENNEIWQDTISAESLQLQKITWLAIKQEVEQQKKYTLKMTFEEITGVIHVGTIDTGMAADGIETNVVKNELELAKSLVMESTFYASLGIKTRILIVVWTAVLSLYIIGFEKLFSSKKRSIVTLAMTANVFAISMYFRVGFEFNASLNYVMFVGLVFAFLVLAVIYIFLLLKKIKKVEFYFAISTLVLGTIYSLILQPFAMPDEEFHFGEAYRLSNAIMGQPINDEQGYIYMRECDINERISCPNNEYTIDMLKALIRGNSERSEEVVASESTRNLYSPIIMYIPQAIGLTIGRLLHVNYIRLIFLGRLMNLLMFTAIGYWAIKIMPYGKWIFFAICQIPMVLESVSSLSYDVPILALTLLFIAYLLRLHVSEAPIGVKQLGIFALLAFIYATLKPVYIPLIALVFILPDKRISNEKWKSLACKAAIMGVGLVSVLLLYKFQFMSMLQIQDDISYAAVEIENNSEMALEVLKTYDISDNIPYALPNLQFVLENPFDLAESFLGAFLTYADEYLLALFGCGLGRLWDLENPMYIGLLTMILLYISCRRENGTGNHLVESLGRLWTIFLIAGSCFAVFLSMYFAYTQPDDKVIRGVQGRYLLPLLMVLPLFLRKKNQDNGTENTDLVMLSLTIQVLAILSVCMDIWNR